MDLEPHLSSVLFPFAPQMAQPFSVEAENTQITQMSRDFSQLLRLRFLVFLPKNIFLQI
jgi:hypothetical protein